MCSRITAQKLGPCMCDTMSHPGNPRSRYHLLSNRFVYELPAAERFFMVVPAGAGDSVQQEIDRLWGSTCHSPQRAGRRTIASSPGRHPTPTISDLKSAIPRTFQNSIMLNIHGKSFFIHLIWIVSYIFLISISIKPTHCQPHYFLSPAEVDCRACLSPCLRPGPFALGTTLKGEVHTPHRSAGRVEHG